MHAPRNARQALLSVLVVAALSARAPAVPAPATPGRAHAVPPGSKPVLGFIEDDYSKALAQARARKLPLFIESWAPW